MDKELRELLIRHEGYRLFPYTDGTGHRTIGIGHNISDNPLPQDMAIYLADNGCITPAMVDRLFNSDVEAATNACRRLYKGFNDFGAKRQHALIDFVFNVGEAMAKTFFTTNKAINEGRWDDAGQRILKLKYAKQVKGRAKEIARMIQEG